MKNLGRIVYICILLTVTLFGRVDVSVNHHSVMRGESVTVRISVFGEEIEPPTVDTLCGSDIVSTSSQQSIQIINGHITKNYSFTYTFEPEKSCTIEPISIKVDGKIEKTKPIKITVTDTPQRTKDANFLLELRANKKEAFVGESFDVTLVFKQKRGAEAIDSKFYPPKLDGFWIKHQSEPKKSVDGEYVVTTIHYKMAAQREGDLKITPAKIKIAMRDLTKDYWNNFAPAIKWKTYYSNAIEMKVYAPPKGVKLVGSFDIRLSVDKTSVHPNEAVNAVITIKGDGNIEDLEAFKPYIPHANVFEEKPVINQENGVFTQKIAFVADESFTIPAFSIRFFDPKTKKIETKSTKVVHIEVIGSKQRKKELVIKKGSEDTALGSAKSEETHIATSFAITWMVLSFFAGAFMGGMLVFLKLHPSTKKRLRRLSTDDKRVLFIKLLPYKDHRDVKELLDQLENVLYGKNDTTIDKGKIKEIINKYNID